MSEPVIINVGGFAAFKGRVRNITPGLVRAAGGMRVVAQMYYIAKNSAEPNKMAGRRTNFWANAGRSSTITDKYVGNSITNPKTEGKNSAFIAITHPAIWQKIKGGTIVPKTRQWLAIPANSIAYGKAPKTFDLRFIKLSPTKAILVTKKKMYKKWKSQRSDGGRVSDVNVSVRLKASDVMYRLYKSITQRPTPGAIPPRADLQRAANEQFGIWLEGQKS